MVDLQKTWTTDYNLAPSTQASVVGQVRSLLRNLVATYKLAGWAVRSSCDGTGGFGNGDGIDRWDSDADVIRATAGNNHSWFVLRSPAGFCRNSAFVELLIDYSTSNDWEVSFQVASSAYTGGTATAAPTATASTFRSFTNKQMVASALANISYHYGYSDDGDVFFLVSANGTGIFSFVDIFAMLDDVQLGDDYTCMTWIGYGTTQLGGLNLAVGGNFGTWAHTGLAITTSAQGLVQWILPDGTNFGLSVTNTGSAIDSALPVWPAVYCIPNRIKGQLVDIYLAPWSASITNGIEIPNSGPQTHTLVGTTWIPNGDEAPIL